jgi:proline iminopeptidase
MLHTHHMKKLFPLLILFTAACTGQQKKQQSISVKDYFAPQDSGVQYAGIKMIPITTPAGNFHVWTKSIGYNPKIKVLLLHGGPAFTHEYMECFQSFFPREGFEMIEYDQLGSFYSDQPKDSSLWTIDRFVEEVEQVRTALGLNKDNFYLLGNSWGSMLAMQYALKYQKNIKGLIICNMMSSIPDFNEYNKKILTEDLGSSSVDSMVQMEARGQTDSPHYVQMLGIYDHKHMCRVRPYPDPMIRGFTHVNNSIMNVMLGSGTATFSGRLANWDIKNRLHEIQVPTLIVSAKWDFMSPDHMKWMSTQVQHARYLYCPEGSHLAMWDDQKNFYPGIIQFIKDVDDGSFIGEK